MFKVKSPGFKTMKIEKLNTNPMMDMAITEPINSNDIVSTLTAGIDLEYVIINVKERNKIPSPMPMNLKSKVAHNPLHCSNERY